MTMDIEDQKIRISEGKNLIEIAEEEAAMGESLMLQQQQTTVIVEDEVE